MPKQTFVLYKVQHKWIVEAKNGSAIEKKEYTSRIKAVTGLFARNPGIKEFYIIIVRAEHGTTTKN